MEVSGRLHDPVDLPPTPKETAALCIVQDPGWTTERAWSLSITE
jgi:hypothetical protein